MQHRPTTLARNGLVSTPHYLASQAGLRILQAGGNAVDAAIAASATLNVVYPILCGTGGDLFMLIWDAEADALHALDASGRSGSLATPERIRAAGHETMPPRGPLSISVPGVVDGWQMASERFGRLGLSTSLQPAISYAEEGFGVSAYMHRSLDLVASMDWAHESWRSVYAPGGVVPAAGSLLRVPELGRSLRLIAEHGRDIFYEGEIGQALVAFLEREGGLITRDDLLDHHGLWVDPLSVEYHGHRIYELPPPTHGVAALEALAIAAGLPRGNDPLAPEWAHPLVEAIKLAFADRAAYVTDPAHMAIDPRMLLADAYIAKQRTRVDPQRAARTVATGPLEGDTIYLCTADGAGNAVSLIQSNYRGVGSGMVLPGYGIELHDRGSYFSLDPAHVNVIAPRKKPMHTLIPSMSFQDDRPSIVLGTQGGDGQPQIHLQLYTALIDMGMDVQAALELPRWIQGVGAYGEIASLLMESRFPTATVSRLREMGHVITPADAWVSIAGHAQAIRLEHTTGLMHGGADPRADGAAAGW